MKRRKRFLILILLLSVSGITMGFQAQNEYTNTSFYDVPEIKSPGGKKVKNIILMIGDGMGVAQVQAAFIANNGQLNIQNCPVTGFSKTSSSDNLTTDSAAAATSMACGVKTYNGAIGVDENGNSVKTILEIAIQNGMKTGLVATCKITHATPASFIAHESTRDRYKEIAKDFLDTPIDVFIGGGRSDFDTTTNGVKLLDQLVQKKYAVVTDIDSLQYISSGKLAGLIHENNQPNMLNGRGDMLSIATKKALELLDNKKGFFLMIEGSQIDWGGHANETGFVIEEMLDFDKVIGEVLAFAANDKETLVVITADHETGGLTIVNGEKKEPTVVGNFSTASHTPVMVPVYAFGPGSELFNGIYENTDIYFKMIKAGNLKTD